MLVQTAQIAIVKIGFYETEGMRAEDGTYYIAIPQIADLVKTSRNTAARDFKRLMGEGFTFVKLSTPFNRSAVNAIALEDVHRLLLSLAASHNEIAAEILQIPITSTKRRKNKNREKTIQLHLWNTLGGMVEVECLAGRIDILTSQEIIEVKQISDWKGGIGQLIVYSKYYPSHSRRLHVFGETQESYLEMIRSHCNDHGITLTWEP